MHSYLHHMKDFNAATRHLTRVERALYRDAIEYYYMTEEPLPAGDFSRLCRVLLATTDDEKMALQFVLDEFFELTGDVYSHDRCDEELEKYRAIQTSKARAGKASAESRRKKAAKRKNTRRTEAQQKGTAVEHTLNTCTNTTGTEGEQKANTIEQTMNHEPGTIEDPNTVVENDDKPGKAVSVPEDPKPKRFVASQVDLPPMINSEAWTRWCKFRSSKRKPISEMAAKQQLEMLAFYDHGTQEQIVDQSIRNDYTGLFAPKQQGGGGGRSRDTTLEQDLRDTSWAQ